LLAVLNEGSIMVFVIVDFSTSIVSQISRLTLAAFTESAVGIANSRENVKGSPAGGAVGQY